jgi:hypothetical protein
MKARVKATGKIVDVYCDFKGMKHDFLDYKGKGYMSNELTIFDNEDYEQGWNDGYYEAVSTNHEPDYWEKLKHQYVGMAMAGICANPSYDEVSFATMADDAIGAAQALVEKLKGKEADR